MELDTPSAVRSSAARQLLCRKQNRAELRSAGRVRAHAPYASTLLSWNLRVAVRPE